MMSFKAAKLIATSLPSTSHERNAEEDLLRRPVEVGLAEAEPLRRDDAEDQDQLDPGETGEESRTRPRSSADR